MLPTKRSCGPLLALLCCGLFAADCVSTGSSTLNEKTDALFPPAGEGNREQYVASGRRGMIATAHPEASKAAIVMLKAGGNAADAAVAASFAISVLRPQSTGIGGGGFLIHYDSNAKATTTLDFRERAPAAASRDMYLNKAGEPAEFTYRGQTLPNASVNGHLAVGVPGLVAGLVEYHQKFGKLPLQDVVAPAIRLAEEGFQVYASLAEDLLERVDVLKVFPSTVAIFFRNGRPLQEGELLVQKDLADTLKRIATGGRAGFYEGPTAEKIVDEMRTGKGILTLNDLKNYRVIQRDPIKGTYRGHSIVSMPPPSSGGIHIVEMLNMLEQTELKALPHGSAAQVHLLAEVMRRAFADRAKYLGDPDFVKVPTKGLIDKEYAKTLFASIKRDKASTSKEIGAGKPPYESPSTTHLSVVDGDGNAVVSTQTVNYTMGSGVVASGTGVVLNNEMDDFSIKPGVPNAYGLVGAEANAVAPGKTMLSSMSPTLVFDATGALKLALGSPGGPRIINATLQTIINVIDYQMSLPEAVHSCRVHHQWLPDHIVIEACPMAETTKTDLRKMGHTLAENKGSIGDVQAVMRTFEGTLIGVSDTRSDGRPMGF